MGDCSLSEHGAREHIALQITEQLGFKSFHNAQNLQYYSVNDFASDQKGEIFAAT